jgi:hypothetical protein
VILVMLSRAASPSATSVRTWAFRIGIPLDTVKASADPLPLAAGTAPGVAVVQLATAPDAVITGNRLPALPALTSEVPRPPVRLDVGNSGGPNDGGTGSVVPAPVCVAVGGGCAAAEGCAAEEEADAEGAADPEADAEDEADAEGDVLAGAGVTVTVLAATGTVVRAGVVDAPPVAVSVTDVTESLPDGTGICACSWY